MSIILESTINKYIRLESACLKAYDTMNKELGDVDREEFVSNINMIDKKIGLKKEF